MNGLGVVNRKVFKAFKLEGNQIRKAFKLGIDHFPWEKNKQKSLIYCRSILPL